MLTQTKVGRRTRITPELAADRIFDRYKKEERHDARKTDVKEDEALIQLKEAWGKFQWIEDRNFSIMPYPHNYKAMCKLIKNLKYSAEDVEKFSLALCEFEHEEYFGTKAGLFLSALVNKGKDKNYVLHLNHLTKKVYGLGYQNTKHVIVNGDVDSNLGAEMKGGCITLNGNAEIFVGSGIKRGKIIVNGNVTHNLAEYMEGGKIIINGNAGFEIGNFMNGGELHLNGEYEEVKYGSVLGGKIFHKGKLICDHGDCVE